MKITRLRIATLAALAFVASFAGSMTQASAASVNVGIQVGGGGPPPPPPGYVDRRWSRPYRSAVWIPGHNEFIRGRWVWVGGYYAYPPRPGGYWVQPRYHHGYYYPGYWKY